MSNKKFVPFQNKWQKSSNYTGKSLLISKNLTRADISAAGVQACEVPSKVVERFYGDISPLTSKGRWQILVECGQNGTEDDVFLVVYGVKGHSSPHHINKGEKLTPGALIISNVSTTCQKSTAPKSLLVCCVVMNK